MQSPTKAINQKVIEIIITSFRKWLGFSKSKNFEAMFDLVLPASNFHELTETCFNSHKSGNDFYYEFEDMAVTGISVTGSEATIKGKIMLFMPGLDIEYCGKFVSSCQKLESTGSWKLNELIIEWD